MLALALLAWTTLAIGALAQRAPMMAMQPAHHPASMTHDGAPMVMASSVPCAGMAHAEPLPHATAPDKPASPDHGGTCPCCDGTGCTCASLCGGMTAIAYLATRFDTVRIALPTRGAHAPLAMHAAPPLRPPIA